MRLLSISVVILAGSLATGASVIANAIIGAAEISSPARFGFSPAYTHDLDLFGRWVAGIGLALFVAEWWLSRNSEREGGQTYRHHRSCL